ncbi:MAG: type IV pilin protein [Candidatus Acidiferrales bacterium]
MQGAHESRTVARASPAAGFSLIELLIVVAIILIVASIAIPNFVRARIQANEAAAVQNLRTISTAQVAYLTAYANGFAPGLPELTGNSPVTCDQAGLIDNALASGQKTGYRYVLHPGTPVLVAGVGCAAPGVNDYQISAEPIAVGSSGQRSFCMTQNGIIRQDPTGAPIAAGSCVPPLAPIQ